MQYPTWMQSIVDWLLYLSETLPAWLYVSIGAALEEIISIIPSSAVLVAAGSLVKEQNGSVLELVWLSLLAGAVKTLINYVFYVFADKIEDKLPDKVLAVLGYDRGEAEKYGKRLSKGWKDAVVLLVLRILPVVPSLPVSLVCGFIKTDIRTYLWTTFVGFSIKSSLYFIVGYIGLDVLQSWL